MNLVSGVNDLVLMRKENEDNRSGVIFPLTRVFDVIYWTHYRSGTFPVLSHQSTTWSLGGPLKYVKQDDGHSCGPIACLTMISVFGRMPTHIQDPTVFPPFAIRAIITKDFRKLLFELKDVIRVKIPKKRRIVDDFMPKKSTRKKQTRDELAEVTVDRAAAQEERILLRKKRASKVMRRNCRIYLMKLSRMKC
jgi:hypothetical protein